MIKKYLLSGIGLVLVIALLITLIKFAQKKFLVNNDKQASIITPSPQITLTPSIQSSPTVIEVESLQFTSSAFPALNFTYPADWKVLFKNHDAVKHEYFFSKKCNDRCYGLKLSKNNVNLILDIEYAVDSNLIQCSNKTTAKNISNQWTRFTDERIIYAPTNQIKIKHQITKNESAYGFGEVSDTWSVVAYQTYDYCIYGEGLFWTEIAEPQLLLFPRVEGEINDKLLQEVDKIISSIEI